MTQQLTTYEMHQYRFQAPSRIGMAKPQQLVDYTEQTSASQEYLAMVKQYFKRILFFFHLTKQLTNNPETPQVQNNSPWAQVIVHYV